MVYSLLVGRGRPRTVFKERTSNLLVVVIKIWTANAPTMKSHDS